MVTRHPKFFTGITGCIAVAIGITVLGGWASNNATLKSIFPGLVTMKVNTALGILLGGVGLIFLSPKKIGPSLRFGTAALAVIVSALGAATLGEYFFGWNLGIDELFFRDPIGSMGTSQPGRMSPATAFCFGLTGIALGAASLAVRAPWRLSLLSALSATLTVIGGTATLGQISNALFAFRLWNYFGMAIQTAVGFVLLGTGLLAFAQNERKITWDLDRKTTIGFAISIAILITVTGVSWNSTHQLQQAAAWVSHTHQVLRAMVDLRARAATLESSQRNYLLLGDEHLLAKGEEAKTDIRQSLEELRRLTADDPRPQKNIDELEALIGRRMELGEQAILLRRQQGLPAVQDLLAHGTDQALSTDIERVFGTLRNEENELLASLEKQSEAVSTTTFLLLPLGVFLSLSILSLALFYLNSGVGEQRRAEEKLRASLREITDLQNALDEHALVAMTDPQGKITYANDKFCAISKYSRQELLGQDHRIVNSGYHGKAFFQDLWTTIAQGKVWHGEMRNRAKDGSFYWVDATIVPFLNEEGRPREYVAIRTDITERKLAEEAMARMAAIVDSSNDAIVGKDLNSIVTTWNSGAEKIFGYTAREMIGQSITRLLPPDRQQEELQIIDRVRNGESVQSFDTLRLAKDGRLIDVSVTVSPIRDKSGKIVGASKVARDVSQKRAAEEEIRQLNTTLEQRVAERTAELEAANKELEAFSYSVSHDLRAPLRAVDGFSQAVMEDYGPQLPEEGRHDLQRIRHGAQRMGALIDDLLAFSRLSRTPMNKQEINTGKQVHDVLEGLTAQLNGRKVDLHLADLPACNGSPAMLEQVWTNLLSNAFKYTRQRNPARIEVGCQNTEADEKVYFVRDNGAGFDMRYANKLFGVFQRLHRAEEFEGTGVGLAIVQRIIQRHGGRIWAEAEPDRGATFYFTLNEKAGS
jgi:PAS domain S-box-containing protein